MYHDIFSKHYVDAQMVPPPDPNYCCSMKLLQLGRNQPLLFMLNGLGYLTLVSALYLPALQQVRRITGFLLIGYTALTLMPWPILGNRSTEGLMDYSVNSVEGVLIVLLLVKSWQERQGRWNAA